MLKKKSLYKFAIIIAVASTVVFRLFIDFIDKFLTSLGIVELEINHELKYLVFSIIQLAFTFAFFYVYDEKVFLIKKINPNYLLIALILGIAFIFFQDLFNWFYYIVLNTNTQDRINYNFKIPTFSELLFAQCLLIPISEELFFREYIQKIILLRYGGHISIVISSLLFSLAHWSDLHTMFLIFLGGSISAILYLKSNSVLPSVLFHSVWNLTIQFI